MTSAIRKMRIPYNARGFLCIAHVMLNVFWGGAVSAQVSLEYEYDLQARLETVNSNEFNPLESYSFDNQGNRSTSFLIGDKLPPLGNFNGTLFIPLSGNMTAFPLVPRCSPVSGCPTH